ncbi:MAG: flagellar biosynthesis protein FlhF [Proteobacteria bacterium]|nr:flagellar biosynthesis protein FlhF [Pseudomonadota bacterium]
MKIKRYTAASMRDALALIRAEQGEEAVILSSRRLEEGVEVVSAVDYDPTLMAQGARPSLATVAAGDAAAGVPADATLASDAATARRRRGSLFFEPPETSDADAAYSRLQRELKDMRRLLESELAAMGWKNRCETNPFNARVLEELVALDIAPDVAQALARHLPRRTNANNPEHIPLALLMKHLPVVADDIADAGGVVAVVGPTGVGKTTTLAKLATRWCLRHGNQDLALVSTDGYRIGARDQLLTYARILDVPMHTAEGGRQLAQVLARLQDKRLVLVDTAGMSQRDARVPAQLDALRLGLAKARVLLAVPAGGEPRAVDETLRAYARVAPQACVLTKIDEAASLGASLSAVLRRKLPIAWLCDGQRVPEDLHAALPKRLWLLRTALALKERAAAPRDAAYMERNFGRVQAHA